MTSILADSSHRQRVNCTGQITLWITIHTVFYHLGCCLTSVCIWCVIWNGSWTMCSDFRDWCQHYAPGAQCKKFEIALCNLLITSIIYHIAHSVEKSIDLTETRAGCFYFPLIVQHKCMFLSTMQPLPAEGHSVAYQCKGLEKQNYHKLLKDNVEYQGHLKATETMLPVKRSWPKQPRLWVWSKSVH